MPGRYGEHLYSTITYGALDTIKPSFGLVIDWEQLGMFRGRNDAYNLDSFLIRRGRQHTLRSDGQGFEQNDIGSFTCTLSDPDEDYNPWNSSSPLYGYLGTNRRMKMVVVTPDESEYDLFSGVVVDVEPTPGIIPKAHITAKDGWNVLKGKTGKVTIPLQENIKPCNAVAAALAEVNWPGEWGSTYDDTETYDTIPYFWSKGRSASELIHELIYSQFGIVYIDASGALTMRGRGYTQGGTPVTLTDANYQWDSFRSSQPWASAFNVTQVKVSPREEQTSGVLWEIISPIPIANGETKEIWATFIYDNMEVPAKDVIEPVATTDFLVNTVSGGGGTDLTDDCVSVAYIFSDAAKLRLKNNSGSDGYINLWQIRGNAITTTYKTTMEQGRDAVLSHIDAIEFVLDSDFMQEIPVAEDVATDMMTYLNSGIRFLEFTLIPDPDLQFSLDLGQIIICNFSSKGINDRFRIAHITHDYKRYRDYTLTKLIVETPYEV